MGAGLKAELARALGDKAEVVSFSPDYADEKYRVNVADFPNLQWQESVKLCHSKMEPSSSVDASCGQNT